MTTRLDADEPAYPWGEGGQMLGGLTKRELFAAMAMQGLVLYEYQGQQPPPNVIARWSVAQADALLAELAKPRGDHGEGTAL